ncbi:putative papain-like cysteine peptidase superfamily [Helianthus debilis subsp. tardiflorus]
MELPLALGQAWPTSDMTLDEGQIKEGCVKVHVDAVDKDFAKTPVPDVTRTDDIVFVGDTLFSFIQWPRDALKLVNKEASSKSASALGALGETSGHSSLSHKGASHTIDIDDIAPTSSYHPQLEEEEEEEEEEVDTSNLHMSSQPQMVPGCFMNMLIHAHEQQTAPQNVFVHEPHMSTQSEVVPDPDQRQQMTTTHDSNPEPKFIDPDVPFALEKLKKRPKEIQEIVDVLSVQVVESIPYSELLQVFLNDWLDISVLHWFAMYFFESSNSGCAFFNPHMIKEDACIKNRGGIIEHIQEVFSFHVDKTFYLAPYIASEHWSLIIICPTTEMGYIIDSVRGKKKESDYLLTSTINDAFDMPFNWEMVKCKQQKAPGSAALWLQNICTSLSHPFNMIFITIFGTQAGVCRKSKLTPLFWN